MRSITRLFKLPKRLSTPGAPRSFSETPSSSQKMFVNLTQEEIDSFEHEKINKKVFFDLAKRLANPENPASVTFSDKVHKDMSALFMLDDLKVAVDQEFASTRNLNIANHDLLNMMRQKYRKNQENIKTVQQRMSSQIAEQKALAEEKFAMDLIATINKLYSNSLKVEEMKNKDNADLVNNTQEGIKLIEQNSMVILRRFGFSEIPAAKGGDADPALHSLANGAPLKKGDKIKKVCSLGFKKNEKVVVKSIVETH